LQNGDEVHRAPLTQPERQHHRTNGREPPILRLEQDH
jgi:hypothetical protein